jgi:hypothetical protein
MATTRDALLENVRRYRERMKGYDNDSFILGPQGCGSHASSEKRSFFWYRSLLFPTNPMGAVLTPVAIP